jgi:hypothetical protein
MEFIMIILIPVLFGGIISGIMISYGSFFQWYHIAGYSIIGAVMVGAIIYAFTNSSESIDRDKSIEEKKYDVLNHIRWIGMSIAGMFAITFIIPNCSGG